MGDIRDILKNNLVFYTKSKQITQKELSDRLGVTQSAVSHWFKGDNSPNIEVVSKIAEILSVPMSALLSESGSNYVAETKESSGGDESAPGEEQPDDPLRTVLLQNFNQLNQEGRERLVETSDDMVSSGKYIKSNSDKLGNEKYA